MNIFQQIHKSVELLRKGEVAGIPTETVYGLAASIDSDAALRRVFAVKERPLFDPLIVHVSSIEQARRVSREFPAVAESLAERFWPGPLTMVLPRSPELNPLISAGLDTVGIRMPRHVVARRVLRETGVPFAAPSANKFGRTSPTNAEHVRKEFARDGVFVVDGGPCEVGLESTVVSIDCSESGVAVRILRPGMVTAELLEAALSSWPVPVTIERAHSQASPGHLENHYMPAIPLVIVPEGVLPLSETRLKSISADLSLSGSRYAVVELEADPLMVARKLYSDLRAGASQEVDFLVVERSARGIRAGWAAIWDRLKKASTLEYLK